MDHHRLRNWHRGVAILFAPFLLAQAISGLVLGYGAYSRLAASLAGEAPQPIQTGAYLAMAQMHFAPGLFSWICHSLEGLGLIWIIGSGAWLWLRRSV